MMNDKITIEIEEVMLAQLLEHAMNGIQETGEFTPTCIAAFKELVNKLPESAWNYKSLHEFADSLIEEGDEDYSFTLEPWDDEDDY